MLRLLSPHEEMRTASSKRSHFLCYPNFNDTEHLKQLVNLLQHEYTNLKQRAGRIGVIGGIRVLKMIETSLHTSR